LKRIELWFFYHVWLCNDFQTSKTDPDIYKKAAKKLGINISDCIFGDDDINVLLAAQKVGMTVIGVYDESSAEDEELIRTSCRYYIKHFSELFYYVKKACRIAGRLFKSFK